MVTKNYDRGMNHHLNINMHKHEHSHAIIAFILLNVGKIHGRTNQRTKASKMEGKSIFTLCSNE